MKVRKLSLDEAVMERSPGQDADIFTGDLIGQADGGPVTIGYGRYGSNQTLTETMAVDDIMIVLTGAISVTTDTDVFTAGPGEIVYMPKGEAVTLRAHAEGATTAYVTYPHWRSAHD